MKIVASVHACVYARLCGRARGGGLRRVQKRGWREAARCRHHRHRRRRERRTNAGERRQRACGTEKGVVVEKADRSCREGWRRASSNCVGNEERQRRRRQQRRHPLHVCARTSVYTRFHPRVLHTLHSLFRLSLPSIRPPPPRVSPFDRLGPSRALSLSLSPASSSIFLRTLPFISCSSLPFAREILSVFRASIPPTMVLHPASSGSLSPFSLSLFPLPRFTGLSRTLSLRCRLPIFRARETGRYSPLCARSFTMLPRLEPRHRRGRLRGVHSPLEPLHGFVACFAICNACARAATN